MNCEPMEVIDQTSDKATACVIFIHGIGNTGETLKNKILDQLGDDAKFPHIKFIFPTAPTAYCAFTGMVHPSWGNLKRSENDPRVAYVELSTDEIVASKQAINQIVNDVVKSGIPKERIILAGESQGGSLAQYTTYTEVNNFKGVLGLCCAYPIQVWDNTRKCIPELPPLYQLNFTNDDVVDLYSAKKGFEFLNSVGVQCKLDILEGEGHQPNRRMYELAYKWIGNMLPNNI